MENKRGAAQTSRQQSYLTPSKKDTEASNSQAESMFTVRNHWHARQTNRASRALKVHAGSNCLPALFKYAHTPNPTPTHLTSIRPEIC